MADPRIESDLGVTFMPDPLARLRLIAAHNSTDPVLANIEGAVRETLARLDARDHDDDPLADTFNVERYRGGDVDVFGSFVAVGTVDDEIDLNIQTGSKWTSIRCTRAAAIEVRDALDVLIRATRRNGGE